MLEVLFVGDFFSCIERTTCTDILIALETPHRVWCHHTDLDGLVGILLARLVSLMGRSLVGTTC